MASRSKQPYIAAAAGVVIVALSDLAVAATSTTSGGSSSSAQLDTTAATQLISTTTLSQMLAISNALTARSIMRMGPPPTLPNQVSDSGQTFSMAAGGAAAQWNIWGNISGNKNTFNDGLSYLSAKTTNTILGGDYALNPTLTVGASAAVDNGDGDTGIPGGTTGYDSSGFTLAPYISWQIDKDWSWDASMGWGQGKYKQTGYSDDKSDRFFYGTNINYVQWYSNIQLTARGSFLHGEEKYKGANIGGVAVLGTNPKNKIDQWRLGVQAAYWMDGVMPYAGVAYSTDTGRSTTTTFATPDNLGKDAWVWSVGVNFMAVGNNLTGGIVYNKESGRSNSKNDNLMANISYRF